MSQPLFRQNITAILLALTGWFFFSVGDSIVRGLTVEYSAPQLIAVSNSIGMILSASFIYLRHGWQGFLTKNWKLFIVRSALVVPISYFVVTALSKITLSDFYGIVFMSPFLITLLSVYVLGERIGIHRIIALAVGFLGVIVLAGPQLNSAPAGIFYATLAMLGGSIVAIIIRKIGRERVSLLYVFFPCAMNTLFYVPTALLSSQTHIPENSLHLALMIALGLTNFFGFLFNSIGYTRASETALIAPFHYSQMIWGVILGFLIFNDIPAITTFTGSLIILVAGLYMLWREYVHHKTNHSVSATITVSGTVLPPEG